jgi:hypothetical protein
MRGGRGHAGHPAGRGGGRAARNDVLDIGRPVWAGEGIPEVELGRLNVARAPSHVLDRAWTNAQEDFDSQMAAFYSLSVEEAAYLLATDQDNVLRLHSPLQNLALYHEAMVFGSVELLGSQQASGLELAAIFLGSAADKNIPISEDTVTAVNRILGLIELSPDDRASLAASAEQVRAALLAGHSEEGEGHDH